MTDRRCSRQRQHSASANSESSYSGSADESSYSGSSDGSSEESTRIIPDPPMSWYPPSSLPSASSSTGSTHDTTAGSCLHFRTLKQFLFCFKKDAISKALSSKNIFLLHGPPESEKLQLWWKLSYKK
ncbi:hypothetical protein LOK49_LG13G02107 [Camellia lanceoleosa]|uniref:Uncharacterized protein n=1 Tax=Camellia lanceoleosa TaxID=1840588 RepID=A0ACC0FNT9_9ERIC|nr:hypothetical protein LOK49_LG13G02107 [Camellia lanceoleosa]